MASTLGDDTTGLGIFEPSQPHAVLDTEEKLTKYLDEYTAEFQSLYISMHGKNMSKDGEIHLMAIQAFTKKGQSHPTIAVVDIKALSHSAFTTASARSPSTSLKSLLESPAYRKWFFDCRKASESLFYLFGITMSNVYSVQLLKNAVDIINLGDDAAEVPKLAAKCSCLVSELGLDKEGLKQYSIRKIGFSNPQDECTGTISDALVTFSVQEVTCLRKLHLVLEKKANQRAHLVIRNASNAQCKRFATTDVPGGSFRESPFTRDAFMTVEELRYVAGSAMIDPEDLRNLNRPSNIPPQDQNRYNTEQKSNSKGARRRQNRRNRNQNWDGQAQNYDSSSAQKSPVPNNYNGYNQIVYDHYQNDYNQTAYNQTACNQNAYIYSNFSHNGYNQASPQNYYQGGQYPGQQSYSPGNYAQNNYSHNGDQHHMASSAVPMLSHSMSQLRIKSDASLDICLDTVAYTPGMNQNGSQAFQPHHHDHHQQQPAPLQPPVLILRQQGQHATAPDTDEARMKAQHNEKEKLLQGQQSSRRSIFNAVNNRLLNDITYLERSDPPATQEQIMEHAAKMIKRVNEVVPEAKDLSMDMVKEITTLEAMQDLEKKFVSHLRLSM